MSDPSINRPASAPVPVTLPGGLRPGKPASPPGKVAPERSGVEVIKTESNGLRGRLAEELATDSDHFQEREKQLIKFHGIYQQDDRDNRKGGKAYSFLIRSRIPGGRLTAEQYLVHEDLADRFGNGTLRITTRQDFQLHGILKGNLKETIRTVNEALITTLGACGDVVRNVMYSPAPVAKPYEREIERIALRISDQLLPRTRAYHEIWIDGEPVVNGKEHVEPVDPLYRDAYLPRKFKIGVAYPGDNSIDVYTQDVGLIALVEGDRLIGFNVLVGGGLGMTHKKPETFPRLADPVGFVTPEEVERVVEEIVLIQRDHGDRVNRKNARLKYLVHRWGIDRFRRELESRLGYALKPVAPTPPLELELYLGWHTYGDDRWYLGLSVENGRIQDAGERRLKAGLNAVIRRFRPGIGLTPSQDIILTGFRKADQEAVEDILRAYGVALESELSSARKYAMACPALPTCPLAIAEAERVLPGVIDDLERELSALGLDGEKLSVRMTGCPNGCARPYVADIGIVGRSLDQYTLFLGGRLDGTRLNRVYRDLVPLRDLVPTLRPILNLFKQHREAGESFGDFCTRFGFERLLSLTQEYPDHAQAI